MQGDLELEREILIKGGHVVCTDGTFFFLNGFFFFFFFWKYQFLKIFCNLVGSIFLDIFALVRYLIDRFDTAGVRKKRQNDFTDTIFFSPCHRDLNIAIANISQVIV